jgi:hypothetical protein
LPKKGRNFVVRKGNKIQTLSSRFVSLFSTSLPRDN